jgi:hypothetical protein
MSKSLATGWDSLEGPRLACRRVYALATRIQRSGKPHTPPAKEMMVISAWKHLCSPVRRESKYIEVAPGSCLVSPMRAKDIDEVERTRDHRDAVCGILYAVCCILLLGSSIIDSSGGVYLR